VSLLLLFFFLCLFLLSVASSPGCPSSPFSFAANCVGCSRSLCIVPLRCVPLFLFLSQEFFLFLGCRLVADSDFFFARRLGPFDACFFGACFLVLNSINPRVAALRPPCRRRDGLSVSSFLFCFFLVRLVSLLSFIFSLWGASGLCSVSCHWPWCRAAEAVGVFLNSLSTTLTHGGGRQTSVDPCYFLFRVRRPWSQTFPELRPFG